MKTLGLDISTKTGLAVLEDGKLIFTDLIKVSNSKKISEIQDLNYFSYAKAMAEKLWELVDVYKPDAIFVEQTNAGKFRNSQKQLEFIHCCFLSIYHDRLTQNKPSLPNLYYVDTSRWRSALKIQLSKEQRKHNKQVKEKKVKGKITPKHLAVSWVNNKFQTQFKLKDNDIADAVCLAYFGFAHFKEFYPSDVAAKIEKMLL